MDDECLVNLRDGWIMTIGKQSMVNFVYEQLIKGLVKNGLRLMLFEWWYALTIPVFGGYIGTKNNTNHGRS